MRLFERSIRWLIKQGYTFISEKDLIEFLSSTRELPHGAVWISLDDGYKEWVDEIIPVIRKYGVPVTLYIPSGIIEGDRRFPWLHPEQALKSRDDSAGATAHCDSMSAAELIRISRFPEVTLGGHTVTHAITPQCSDEQLGFEIVTCKSAVQAWTPTPVSSFSYPCGSIDGRERKYILGAGFSIAVTTEPRFVNKETDPILIPRFCVPDDASFPEAICNMVGEWQPAKRTLRRLLRTIRGASGPTSSSTAPRQIT